MMKKLVMVGLLVLMVAGAASADYVWNMTCTDSLGGSAGTQVRTGFKASPGTTSAQSWTTSTSAYGAYVEYTGGLDATFTKTGLFKTNYDGPADPSKFIVAAWVGSGWDNATQGGTFDVRLWGSTTTNTPTAGWKVYKLYDPITDTWGHEVLTNSVTGTTAINNTGAGAVSDNPWFKASLPVFKAADPMVYRGGYILSLEVPEPGSMVAMLSGLVGLVGFGIRRRK